jgi:hypothetical protein
MSGIWTGGHYLSKITKAFTISAQSTMSAIKIISCDDSIHDESVKSSLISDNTVKKRQQQ